MRKIISFVAVLAIIMQAGSGVAETKTATRIIMPPENIASGRRLVPIPSGWKVIEDKEPIKNKAWVEKTFSQKPRACPADDIKECYSATLTDAEVLLQKRKDIPSSFRKGRFVFEGTKLEDQCGAIYVPVVIWDKNDWRLKYRLVKGDFYCVCDDSIRPWCAKIPL